MMMRGSYFDDEGTVHTWGFPCGTMLVSMEFDDREEEIIGADGQVQPSFTDHSRILAELNTVYCPHRDLDARTVIWMQFFKASFLKQPETVVAHFNKRERFQNVMYNPFTGRETTLWNMVNHPPKPLV